jgi:hypothetical protein
MAITSAGDLKGMISAAATIAGTITGIQRTYDKAGEIPASDAHLPAIVQTITAPDLPPIRVEHMISQQAVNHYWYMDVLINRGGDLYAEQDAALPFIPLILAKFNANIDLGYPTFVAMCKPESFRFVILSHGDQAFFTLRTLMHCRGKSAVDYTAA